jgi:hypothetical protein
VSHASAVRSCWTELTEECFRTGLGPESFDCSGFVIACLSESCSRPLDAWRRDVRHVREFWSGGTPTIGSRVEVADAQAGDILISQRIIRVEGVRDLFPCHTSIVTGNNRELPLRCIGTSHETGFVVETEVSEFQRGRLLGAIALDPEKIYN